MSITQWHVPVDDTHCYWYAIFTSFAAPVDKATMRAQRLETHSLPDYVPHAGRSNDWGYDPEEQRSATYTGMGMDINVHDQWAVESMGAIQDRTSEHLGYSDRIITAARRMIFRAIDDVADGRDPPLTSGADAVCGPTTIDCVGPVDGPGQLLAGRGGGAAARHALAGTGKGNRVSDFVARHGLWTQQQEQAAAEVARADRETRHRALRVLRCAWRGARQDADRGRGHRRAAQRRHLHRDDGAERPVRAHRISRSSSAAATAPATWSWSPTPPRSACCPGRRTAAGSCATCIAPTARRIRSPPAR